MSLQKPNPDDVLKTEHKSSANTVGFGFSLTGMASHS
jgi:hypothetical protein